jgi:integrase/recombinase XerD
MNSSVSISLDTRRAKKDGSYPIVIRISHGRNTINIQSGYDVIEKHWDSNNRKIRSSCTTIDNVTRANNTLLKKKSDAVEIIVDLETKGILNTYSTKQLKERILGCSNNITYFEYTQSLIDILIRTNHVGNARNYKNTLDKLKSYRKGKDFKIEEINYRFLKDFEIEYLSNGNSYNGLSVYMRNIRAVFNRAIKDGLVDKALYPFQEYTIKEEETEKRAISLDAIMRIDELDLEESSGLFLARNLFLFSFYTMGTSFIDLAFMKKSNIKNDRIKYTRIKTGAKQDIAVIPEIQPILNYYLEGKSSDDYIFPIIKGDDSNLVIVYKKVLWALQRHNKRLKKIAQLADIDDNLTSYVARHSFASIANEKGIPLTVISKMLTHKKLNTTQVYLADLSKNLMDDFHGSVFKKSDV